MTGADDAFTHAARIADAVQGAGKTVAAAESISAGNVARYLAAAEGASTWFHGSVVAYGQQAKFDLLEVDPGPVITARCAEQMARGVAALLKSDFAVATTGAGGPGAEEDQPPGTVFIAVLSPTGCEITEHHFDGDPAAIVDSATVEALRALALSCDCGEDPRR